MKLLQLNATANWGSTGRIAEGIGEAAMSRGWESAIAYGRSMNPSKSRLIKVGDSLNPYIHYTRHRIFDGEGLGSRSATKKLIEQIKEYSPDIIHLHNIHDHWLNYPLLFEYFASIDTPIVWTFHDCWAFTGGCAYFDRVNCDRWMTKCHSCPCHKNLLDRSDRNFKLKRKLLLPLIDRLTVVSVSNWIREFCEMSSLKDVDLELIHNGIDLSVFHPYKGKNKVILGVASPWSPRKGLDDIILLRQFIDTSIEIKLIGLDSAQIKSLPKGITGIERTNSASELAMHYSEACVFINPTYEDNFPTTNIESLACGTPVVTYRTGGSPEAIDSSTGIVIEKGDIKEMANAIMQILNNPDKFNAEYCRARAEKYFNKDIQFNKYIDLYDNLLAEQESQSYVNI